MKIFGMVCFLACLGAVSTPLAQAGILIGPTPYLAFDNTLPGAGSAISPFSGLSFDYFHLQNFESFTPGSVIAFENNLDRNQLSTGAFLRSIPNVGGGGNGSVISSPASSIVDSVDADDGLINGSGSNGRSLFTNNAGAGFKISFSLSVLGALPTHAGLVWTDGQGGTVSNVIFEAFDANNASLGTITAGGFQDNVVNGTTGEDRFFGASHLQGISAITIRQTGGGGLEVDHLQYGRMTNTTQTVPEPASMFVWALLGLAIVGYPRMRSRLASVR